MAISQKPESEVQQTDPQNQSADPQNQQNQSTNSEDLIRTVLGEAERARTAAEQRARDLEDQLTQLRNSQQSNHNQQIQSQDQNKDPNEFWKNPVDNINKLIADQVKPLIEFTRGATANNQYTQLKAQYRNYNGFGDLEPFVDQLMNGADPTHANIQAAIQRAVGHVALNRPDIFAKINGSSNNQQQQQNQIQDPAVIANIPNQTRDVQNQAHLRPSRNQLETKKQENKRRPLTENERVVIKNMGVTEDRYFELLDSGTKVSDWKKPEAKK